MRWHRVILAGIRAKKMGVVDYSNVPLARLIRSGPGFRRGRGLPLHVAGFIEAAALQRLHVAFRVAATGSRGSAG
jgi:hypothetical protein